MPWIRTGNINYLYRRPCLLSFEIIPGFQVQASAAVSLEVPSQCDNVCNPSASVTPHVLPLPPRMRPVAVLPPRTFPPNTITRAMSISTARAAVTQPASRLKYAIGALRLERGPVLSVLTPCGNLDSEDGARNGLSQVVRYCAHSESDVVCVHFSTHRAARLLGPRREARI